jgi:hypothetical protein
MSEAAAKALSAHMLIPGTDMNKKWQRQSSRTLPEWTRIPPNREGWYWYRDANRDEVVLHVFDPIGNKQWKAWDWKDGRLELCGIAGYEGEWWGPLEVPQ